MYVFECLDLRQCLCRICDPRVFHLQLTLSKKWVRTPTACSHRLCTVLPPGGRNLLIEQLPCFVTFVISHGYEGDVILESKRKKEGLYL